MALGFTQPLTEMSTRNIYWGVKTEGAYGWQPYRIHVPIVLQFRSPKLLEPSGPVQACNEIAVPLRSQQASEVLKGNIGIGIERQILLSVPLRSKLSLDRWGF